MRTIWRYSWDLSELDDIIVTKMPSNATVRSAGTKFGNDLCIWAEVEPDNPLESRYFLVRGTGHPFSGREGNFIDTVIYKNYNLVFHVYEYNGE
jgi:hypothetical protein